MAYDLDRDLKSLVDELEQRKKEGHQPVLVLGSSAGGLYRSDYFLYEHMLRGRPTDLHSLHSTTRRQCFKQVQHLVNERAMNEHDINEFIKTSFRNIDPEEYDICLALLIKNNYFYEIVSTNIDFLVEESFENVGMREGREFEVFFPRESRTSAQSFSEKVLFPGVKERDYRIIKIFGDFLSREYQISQRFAYFENKPEFKQFLHGLFKSDLLILGLHPDWDEEILHLIPSQGGKLWFVGEEDLSELSIFRSISKTRVVQHIINRHWKYHNIATALYRYSTQNNRHASVSEVPLTTQPRSSPQESEAPVKLYFSYANDAQAYAKRLQVGLARLRKHNLVNDWHRGMINAGEDRFAMPTTHLTNAQIILLGISPEFILSDITCTEAELAMQRHATGEVVVIPIHLVHVDSWGKEPFGKLEALPRGNRAISTYDRKSRRDKVLEDIVSEIEKTITRFRLKGST